MEPGFEGCRLRPRGPDLRVPFGERNGRLYRPEQVASGLACACICPQCRTALEARNRQFEGRKTRPYFAHAVVTDCTGAYETAIHRMAKQILADAREILLPRWHLRDCRYDYEGRAHAVELDISPRRWAFDRVQLEVPFQRLRPDALLTEFRGETRQLMVEVHVAHAVDASKTAIARENHLPMIEIDLRDLEQSDLEEARLVHLVLFDQSNRRWVYHPRADNLFKEKLLARDAALAEANRRAQKRITHREQAAVRRSKRKADAREATRKRLRAPFEDDIADLLAGAKQHAGAARIYSWLARDGAKTDALLERMFPSGAAPEAFDDWHPDAWAVNAHPRWWQACLFEEFIWGRRIGHQISLDTCADWVEERFTVDNRVRRLWDASQIDRTLAVPRARRYQAGSAWFFSVEELAPVPSLIGAIRKFLNALVHAQYLRPIGAVARPPDARYAVCQPQTRPESEEQQQGRWREQRHALMNKRIAMVVDQYKKLLATSPATVMCERCCRVGAATSNTGCPECGSGALAEIPVSQQFLDELPKRLASHPGMYLWVRQHHAVPTEGNTAPKAPPA
ncbi:MAG: hypothetical protein JWP44_4968 [Mucilaginibacter sp.]|nr:hypothetical protein [Mucilaginibacter sp.]